MRPIDVRHRFHVPAPAAGELRCAQVSGSFGFGEYFVENASDFHRRAYAKPGADGVHQLIRCYVSPHSDHKFWEGHRAEFRDFRRSGKVVHVSRLRYVYPEFIVSYIRSAAPMSS